VVRSPRPADRQRHPSPASSPHGGQSEPSASRQVPAEQKAAEFTAQYARRAAVEGTHAQAVRRCGLRQSRYIGHAKTHLQHLITAVALNVVRLHAWWWGMPPANARCSAFAALQGAVA
jgi:transposase